MPRSGYLNLWIKFLTAIMVSTSFFISGCTSIKVMPLNASYSIERVAIKENPRVTVPGFLCVVQNEFENHGITTIPYQNQVPPNCQAILTYTALKSWDVTTYLSHAELTLRNLEGKRIAQATYHLQGKGGFDLSKWDSVQSKMKPVIDQLLQEYE